MLKLYCFHWIGVTDTKQSITGHSYAYSYRQLESMLAQQQIRPDKVIQSQVSMSYRFRFTFNNQQLDALTLQFITLLEAGFPIIQAIRQLRDRQRDKRFELYVFLDQILSDISQGESLHSSLSKHHYFDTAYLQFVAAGESNGRLVESLQWALHQREKKAAIHKKIRAACLYPSMVVVVALLVMILMLMVVIPQFENLFLSFGSELPPLTQATLDLSIWLQSYGVSLFISFSTVSVVIYKALQKNHVLTRPLHKWILLCPILGKAIQSGEWARFSLVLSSSIQSGTPILHAWQQASSMVNNHYLKQFLINAKRSIESGNTLHQSIINIPTLPDSLGMLVAIGESSGKLPDLLQRAATNLEQQLVELTDNINKLIEPITILLLGVIVGTLVLSIYLPIFSLMNSFN
ncbi:type II secretion system F family protein [Vibrio gallicus]|uniref:type II secretion system F family protein n=1 Tax=Vibrio gallicus TaxID=190897 RepID=UPI0021C45E72|nr:type II secretion system F family protein [Vibrio gallicus]